MRSRLARPRALCTAYCRNSEYSRLACLSCAGEPVDGFQTCLPLALAHPARSEWLLEILLAILAQGRCLSAKPQHPSLRGQGMPLSRHAGGSFPRHATTPVAPGFHTSSPCWPTPTYALCNSGCELKSGMQHREGLWALPVRSPRTVARKPNHTCSSHLGSTEGYLHSAAVNTARNRQIC